MPYDEIPHEIVPLKTYFKQILNLASLTHPIIIFFDNLQVFFVDEHKEEFEYYLIRVDISFKFFKSITLYNQNLISTTSRTAARGCLVLCRATAKSFSPSSRRRRTAPGPGRQPLAWVQCIMYFVGRNSSSSMPSQTPARQLSACS